MVQLEQVRHLPGEVTGMTGLSVLPDRTGNLLIWEILVCEFTRSVHGKNNAQFAMLG